MVRLAPEQKAQIKARARALGLGEGQFIRAAIDAALTQPTGTDPTRAAPPAPRLAVVSSESEDGTEADDLEPEARGWLSLGAGITSRNRSLNGCGRLAPALAA
jgi:hypothetical protein